MRKVTAVERCPASETRLQGGERDVKAETRPTERQGPQGGSRRGREGRNTDGNTSLRPRRAVNVMNLRVVYSPAPETELRPRGDEAAPVGKAVGLSPLGLPIQETFQDSFLKSKH